MVEITSNYTLEETRVLLEKIIVEFGKEQITTANWTMFSKDVPRLWHIIYDILGLDCEKTEEVRAICVDLSRREKQKGTMGKMLWDKERFPNYRDFRHWFKEESEKSEYAFEVMRCYPRSICTLLQENKASLSSPTLSEFYRGLFVHWKVIKKISIEENNEALRLIYKVITNSLYGMLTGGLMQWNSPFEPKHHYDVMFEKAREYMKHAVVDGIITKQDSFQKCVSVFEDAGYEIDCNQ